MQQLFDQLGGLKAPVLGLYGDKDQSIPVGTIEEFDKLLDQIGVEHEVDRLSQLRSRFLQRQ